MAKNTFEVSVGKFCGLELKDMWHCRRNVHKSSGFILSNVLGTRARTWVAMGRFTWAGGAGSVFWASLSKAQMKWRIRSSCPPVGTGSASTAACGRMAYWGNWREGGGGREGRAEWEGWEICREDFLGVELGPLGASSSLRLLTSHSPLPI